MAVTIKKKKLTITSLVTRLFGAEEVAGHDFLKKAQELEQTGGNGAALSTVPLKSETVTLAMKKKIGHTVKVIIKDKVIDLINVAYQKYLDNNLVAAVTKPKPDPSTYYDAVMQVYHSKGGNMKVAAIKKYRELSGASLKEAKDQVEAWIDLEEAAAGELPIADEPTNTEEVKLQQQTVYPVELDLNATPVGLRQAQKLNQPVCGTSGGSIYHVIALGKDCVVAARIKKNNEIAIRAEILAAAGTPEHSKAKSGLEFAGLDLKSGGHYSLHLDAPDFGMVKRSIGSTLMSMSIPFFGVNTNLHDLQGAGK
jgi:hypothetical protein